MATVVTTLSGHVLAQYTPGTAVSSVEEDILAALGDDVKVQFLSSSGHEYRWNEEMAAGSVQVIVSALRKAKDGDVEKLDASSRDTREKGRGMFLDNVVFVYNGWPMPLRATPEDHGNAMRLVCEALGGRRSFELLYANGVRVSRDDIVMGEVFVRDCP
jgi:hypothetical protein